MNLAAKFSLSKNRSNVVERSTTVPLAITDGRDLGEPEPGDAGCDDELGIRNSRDQGIEELIASLRTGEVSNWGKERIRKVLRDRFEHSTAAKIYNDIASVGDTSHWNSLLKEAYANGYRKEDTVETVDWEALLHAPFAEIAGCIRDRGNQSQMAFRILVPNYNCAIENFINTSFWHFLALLYCSYASINITRSLPICFRRFCSFPTFH